MDNFAILCVGILSIQGPAVAKGDFFVADVALRM